MAKAKKKNKPKKNRRNLVKKLRVIENNNKIISEFKKMLLNNVEA